MIPTPITLSGKRGGTLRVGGLAGQPVGFDTYESGTIGIIAYEIWLPMFNNLLWPDPYGGGHILVGDAAERWEISQGGTVLTFFLRKGIQFHDGTPLTSKDVVYNVDRGVLHPRTPTMTFFQPRLRALQKVEAVDDLTVRLTLSGPSNSALQALAMNQMLMYPSHFPFPERIEEFKKNPIGTGPFKFKSVDIGVKTELVRNGNYWKRDLPYLDSIVYTPIVGATWIAAVRAGRIDASLLNVPELQPSVVDTLKREAGFVAYPMTVNVNQMILNNRAPWTDKRGREALSLAIDRQSLVTLWVDGAGSPYASPLLPPELGGSWGISAEVLKARPGFRPDKGADLARAKQLLAEAGVRGTVSVLTSESFRAYGEVVDANLRAVGISTKLEILESLTTTQKVRNGDFDIYLTSASLTFDDPSDYLTPWVLTGSSSNFGKWSWPELDTLLADQDKTLDETQRKEMLLRVQEMILGENFGAFIPTVVRTAFSGHQPWVKNFPKLPFSHSPRYRWDQVFVER